jgi:uncharacterized protein (DUF305 family)
MTNNDVLIILQKINSLSIEGKSLTEMQKREMQFLKDMIVHHEMALKMADKVMDSDRLKAFAKNIKDTQSGEITQMKKWLEQWFNEEPSTMNHGS